MDSEIRLAKLQSILGMKGIDLAAIGPTAAMRYLLGFVPHADERLCLLLVSPSSACIVTPGLNREEMAAHTTIRLLGWADEEGPQAALRQAMAGQPKVRTLAADGAVRADSLLQLQGVTDPQTTVAVDPLIRPLRICKSGEEVEALARAAAQADRAMQVAVDACRPGATEAEVSWVTESAFRQSGAQEVSFTLIASGPNGAFPHHHSGARKLQRGDAIVMDIGASLDGYKSDITRMVHLGEPSPEFRQAFEAVLRANQGAIAAVRPGVTAREIDRVARSTLEKAGYGQLFTHRTGHGIGLETHEPPWIMSGESTVLETGMAFSVEPGVYWVGQFGVRIEDILVVTTTGARVLTGYDHSLVVKE